MLPVMAPQCQAQYFFPMFMALVGHLGSVLFRGSGWKTSLSFGAVVMISILWFFSNGTYTLTFMHQIVGMLSTEAAIRVARAPMWTVRTKAELFMVFCAIVPNLSVTLSETVFNHCQGAAMWTCRPRGFESFAHNALFRKQHAVLHFALSIMLTSMGSSYWDRLRKSRKVQLVRAFLDPTCVAVVANVLLTHSHGDTHHELASHPAIAQMMYTLGFIYFVSCMAQLALAPGSDLTEPLPNGGPPALLGLRLVTAFAALLLANFLYVDTFMEYLGCRTVIIKPGGDDDPSRVGWSPATELSTYMALTAMLAVLTLAAMILVNPTVTGLSDHHAVTPAANKSDSDDMEAGVKLLADESSESELMHAKAGTKEMGRAATDKSTSSGASSEEEA